MWQQLKNDWPQALCWGLTFAILWATIGLGTANWVIYTFSLTARDPKPLPHEIINSLIFGLLGMKGLNIIHTKVNEDK